MQNDWVACTLPKLLRYTAPLGLLCALSLHAQESSPTNSGPLPAAPAPQQINFIGNSFSEPAPPASSQPVLKNNRLFYVLANYSTVEKHDEFSTLSARTKFKLSIKTMTDPVTVSFLGAIALIGQARNSDPSYGQGLQGYSKRYATTFADTGVGTLMTTSVFPTLLHQDPRYFQLGTGGKWHRVKYSVSRIFITRSDNGATQFNYSEVVGNAVAAGISNTYHPEYQRTFGNTMNVWGTEIVLNTICNLAKEFWPDLRRAIHNRRHPE
ncbi:MAG TPA: hypothetical protein VFI45_06560 [Candidatus Acidoferrum sp.]|nr:hypothetical protein [Candidatus Acidoferrum sp.]